MRAKILILPSMLLLWLAAPALAEIRLVMVEQDGCIYCEHWHEEVGDIYPLTEFAQTMPLRFVDLRDLPDDITFDARVVFTPTFVLTEDGTEIARAEGYAGDELFWMHMEILSRALTAHQARIAGQ